MLLPKQNIEQNINQKLTGMKGNTQKILRCHCFGRVPKREAHLSIYY